jgi:ADP-ribose pyrophosphatase YjhB (NUDIX family)
VSLTPQGHPIKLLVTVSLIRGNNVLFVKYKPPIDDQGGWILPTATVADNTHPDDAARNVLGDDFSIQPSALRLSHVESFAGRDGTWHVPLHYSATLPAEATLMSSANIAEFRWFSHDALPSEDEQAYHGWSGDIVKEVLANKNRKDHVLFLREDPMRCLIVGLIASFLLSSPLYAGSTVGKGNRVILAAYWGDDKVALIDLNGESGHEEVWTLDTLKTAGCPKPYDVRANKRGDEAFVSCSGADKIAVIDIIAQQIKYTVTTGSSPRDLQLFDNDRKLIVANSGNDTVSVVNVEAPRLPFPTVLPA